MPVIGLKFESFSGSRTKEVVNQPINVNSTPKIKDIKEISLPNIADKAMSFHFEFVTSYDPDIGSIRVTGEIFFVSKDFQKIMSEWKKKKELPADVSTEVLNYLFRRCLLKISNMAEDLQLPPAVNFPRVKAAEKQQEPDYVG